MAASAATFQLGFLSRRSTRGSDRRTSSLTFMTAEYTAMREKARQKARKRGSKRRRNKCRSVQSATGSKPMKSPFLGGNGTQAYNCLTLAPRFGGVMSKFKTGVYFLFALPL